MPGDFSLQPHWSAVKISWEERVLLSMPTGGRACPHQWSAWPLSCSLWTALVMLHPIPKALDRRVFQKLSQSACSVDPCSMTMPWSDAAGSSHLLGQPVDSSCTLQVKLGFILSRVQALSSLTSFSGWRHVEQDWDPGVKNVDYAKNHIVYLKGADNQCVKAVFLSILFLI